MHGLRDTEAGELKAVVAAQVLSSTCNTIVWAPYDRADRMQTNIMFLETSHQLR